jgi:hypothetical protein
MLFSVEFLLGGAWFAARVRRMAGIGAMPPEGKWEGV